MSKQPSKKESGKGFNIKSSFDGIVKANSENIERGKSGTAESNQSGNSKPSSDKPES